MVRMKGFQEPGPGRSRTPRGNGAWPKLLGNVKSQNQECPRITEWFGLERTLKPIQPNLPALSGDINQSRAQSPVQPGFGCSQGWGGAGTGLFCWETTSGTPGSGQEGAGKLQPSAELNTSIPPMIYQAICRSAPLLPLWKHPGESLSVRRWR